MPSLEISLPRQTKDVREKLVSKLTDDFARYTNYDVEAFGIRFLEYDVGESANAGRIWDGKTGKPYIHFKMFIPRRTVTEKSNMIKAFTESFADCLGRSDWAPVIYFCELDDDSVGFSGKSLAEHKNSSSS